MSNRKFYAILTILLVVIAFPITVLVLAITDEIIADVKTVSQTQKIDQIIFTKDEFGITYNMFYQNKDNEIIIINEKSDKISYKVVADLKENEKMYVNINKTIKSNYYQPRSIDYVIHINNINQIEK